MTPPPTSRRAAAPTRAGKSNDLRFHFLHGDDEAGIENAKRALVEKYIPTPEEREENYREIIPPAGSGLKRVLGSVLSELSTASFLPDTLRLVTLYTVGDFFEAKTGGKAKPEKAAPKAKAARGGAEVTAASTQSPSEILAEWLEKDFPTQQAALIIIALEDYEKWKRVNHQNPVVALAARNGTIRGFKEESPQFAFFDALFDRQPEKAIRLWRQWLEHAGNSNPKPYLQLATQLRLLMQAKMIAARTYETRGVSREQFDRDCLPAEPDRNVTKLQPAFRMEKLVRQAARFTFQELTAAYDKLMPIQKFVIPVSTDVYVPDKALLAELWILQLTVGRRSG